jgi:hypothetical protein
MTPTDVADRLRRDLAREAARTQATMLRPLAQPGRAPRRGLAGRGLAGRGLAGRGLAGGPARRWLAPAAAVVAVAAVLAGVALAGSGIRARPGATAGGATATAGRDPRFYVSVTLPPHVGVVVHAAHSGRVLSKAWLPGAQGAGPLASIAAAGNDRTFAIAATVHLPNSTLAVRLYELSLSGRGRVVSLATITDLTPPASADTVTGIALSPDNRELAATVEIPTSGFHPRGEIEVLSLRTGRAARTWTGGAGIPSDPAWQAGGRKLGFLWWDHIRGPVTSFTARTRERRLDTAAPGRSLLGSSQVIAAAPDGRFLQSAVLSADGRALLGSWYHNIPAGHGTGTAVVEFGRLGLNGRRTTVIQWRAIRFRGPVQEGETDSSCNVLSVAGRDHATLVQCPGLERVQNGSISSLPGLGQVPIAAW